MFTTTCILILYEEYKISLNDKISYYLSKEVVSGLHVYNGKDYSYELTISDLLFQTSGLPNPFEEGKNSISKKFFSNDSNDMFIDFN